jgi:hypothetical protein
MEEAKIFRNIHLCVGFTVLSGMSCVLWLNPPGIPYVVLHIGPMNMPGPCGAEV